MLNTTVSAMVILILAFGCNRSPAPDARLNGAGTTGAGNATTSAAAPASTGVTTPSSASAGTLLRNFDDDPPNALPRGIATGRTGRGAAGRWIVLADPSAPSAPNVLAQVDTDSTNYRFPIAVFEGASFQNVRVSVRCKPVSGRVDQACGLVARYTDENNYYITRANSLEDNIRLYTVKGGSRDELASFDGRVVPNAWHEYRLELHGDHLTVYWDGAKVLDHHDSTFGGSGRVGVWTKADSITHFDDFRAEGL